MDNFDKASAQSIEQQLYDAGVGFIKNRYPMEWGGCAVMRLSSGEIVISVAPEIKMEGLGLCMEVGATLEAHKKNLAVTHSLCLFRHDENSEFIILSPCGVCQERLGYWGGDVQVAITTPENSLTFTKLRALQPHYWLAAFNEAF